jgi:hypothetical protein
MPRTIHGDCSRLSQSGVLARPAIGDRLTFGSSLNSAGVRRRGTLADILRDAIVLLDLSAVVSGRAGVNMV